PGGHGLGRAECIFEVGETRSDGGTVRALILWSERESANLGVRALARGTEALLERSFSGIETSAQSFGNGDAPTRIGNLRGQAKRLMTPKDELVEWVRTFDLVVDTRAGD